MHIDTPLLQSSALSRSGREVWLKMEALQVPGSFKIRGIGHACANHAKVGARRFVAASGGNAGIAAAYAGRRLGIPVLVVVPETTSERARELLQREGATLLVQGASFQEANAHALSLLEPADGFIHPYDDPLLWQGHASLVDEVAGSGLRPDAVVLSAGGGGLLCGVLEGLHRNGMADVPVVAVETAGADSLAQAMAAGHTVELPGIASVATSLGARRVAQAALDWTRRHPVTSAVVTDGDAARACLRFLDDQRVLVEPACGASLAVVYGDLPQLAEARRILVVVCGGVTATLAQLQAWAGHH